MPKANQRKDEKQDPAAELAAVRDRIRLAKAERPRDTDYPHCADCYSRGWAAALRKIDG